MSRRSKGPRLYLRSKKGRDHVWVIRDGQKEISTGACESDIGSAEQRLAEYIGGKHTPDFGTGRPDQVLIADVLTLYVTERGLPPGSLQTAAYTGKALLGFWGESTCDAVSPVSCNRYADYRRGMGIKDGTIRREMTTLGAALNYAVSARKLMFAPPITMPPPPASKDRWLTRQEATLLLAAALGFYVTACDIATRQPIGFRRDLASRSIHLARFIVLGLYTGSRASVVCGLRWGVNSSGGWIDLANSVLYRRAAGQRETNKRAKPIRPPVRLLAHMRRARKNTVNGPVEYHGAIIAEIDTSFNRAARMAGLEGVTPHTLKHTAASWGMMNGVDPWRLADYLSTSMKTLLGVYGHLHPDYQAQAAEGIGKKVARPGSQYGDQSGDRQNSALRRIG